MKHFELKFCVLLHLYIYILKYVAEFMLKVNVLLHWNAEGIDEKLSRIDSVVDIQWMYSTYIYVHLYIC